MQAAFSWFLHSSVLLNSEGAALRALMNSQVISVIAAYQRFALVLFVGRQRIEIDSRRIDVGFLLS